METSSAHPVELAEPKLLEQCEIRRTRGSGPGGQHRNKVETAIQIRHLPSEVTAEASERRSQNENRRVALQRLRVELALRVRTTRPDYPSPLWRRRTKNSRIAVAVDHDDFPRLLAEALDCIAAEQNEAAAAERLQVTTSQLVKLLKRDSQALILVNHWRAQRGERALK